MPLASVRVAISVPSQRSSRRARTPGAVAPAHLHRRAHAPARPEQAERPERRRAPSLRACRGARTTGFSCGGLVSVGSGPSPRSWRIAASTGSSGSSSQGILCRLPGRASRDVVLGEDLGDVAIPALDVAVVDAPELDETRHPAGAPPRARAVRLPRFRDTSRRVDVMPVLVHERVCVRFGLGRGDRDHPAAVAAAGRAPAPLDERGGRDEVDPNGRDLVGVRRGAEQRGIPLDVDAFGADVEPDRAALVVRDDDLLSGRLAGEGEREEGGDEQERAAHEHHGSHARSRIRKSCVEFAVRPRREIVRRMGIGAILVIIGIVLAVTGRPVLGIIIAILSGSPSAASAAAAGTDLAFAA